MHGLLLDRSKRITARAARARTIYRLQHVHMAGVVSDVLLSFFCCCFYPPGGPLHHHHGGDVGTHHYGSSGGCHAAHHHHHHRHHASRTSRSMPMSLQTVELKVRMCCEGCERVVRQSLLNLRGVDSVEVDARTKRVRVTGYVERGKVLREVRRSGKKAEFWPTGAGGTPLRFTSPRSYFRRDENGPSYSGSYNYRRGGYGYGDGDRHGRMRAARGADPVSNMFNDDDVTACAIM